MKRWKDKDDKKGMRTKWQIVTQGQEDKRTKGQKEKRMRTKGQNNQFLHKEKAEKTKKKNNKELVDCIGQ